VTGEYNRLISDLCREENPRTLYRLILRRLVHLFEREAGDPSSCHVQSFFSSRQKYDQNLEGDLVTPTSQKTPSGAHRETEWRPECYSGRVTLPFSPSNQGDLDGVRIPFCPSSRVHLPLEVWSPFSPCSSRYRDDFPPPFSFFSRLPS